MQASYDLLRAARAALDMSATDLCKKAGISKRSLVRIEAGEPVRLEISLSVQKVLEQAGVEFLSETETEGPGIGVRKGIARKIGFQIEGYAPIAPSFARAVAAQSASEASRRNPRAFAELLVRHVMIYPASTP